MDAETQRSRPALSRTLRFRIHVEHTALASVFDAPSSIRQPRVDVVPAESPLSTDAHGRQLIAVEHAIDGLLRDHQVLGELSDGENVTRALRHRHEASL